MRKKIKIISIVVIIVIGLAGYIVSKHILPYSIIKPPRVSEKIVPSDLDLISTDINVFVDDSINIKGYWIKSDSIPAKSLIILVHGVGGCKEHFLNLSKSLSKIGVESVLIDNRAHGQSGGQYCTFGYNEKKDIANVIDFIKSKNDSIPIGIWGNSMGGAIAIQALEFDNRIKFGIIESTFTDLNQIVYDYQKSFSYNIGLKPICNIALNEAGKIAKFNPDSVSPISSVKNIEQPILIAHGEQDENIKFEYGKLLFDNLKSKNKKFIPVKNGGHYNLGKTGGKEYLKAIENFILDNSI